MPTAPTLDVDEVIDVLNTRRGRAVPALDMILEAMETNLWPVLEGLGFREATAKPAGYFYAGEAGIGEKGWPAIIVGGAFNSTEFGMGHMDEAEIAITCAFAPQIDRRQLQLSLDVATVASAILYHPEYRANMKDPDDATVRLWNELHPVGYRIVPGDFPHYSGWQARFVLRQPPQSNLWNDRTS